MYSEENTNQEIPTEKLESTGKQMMNLEDLSVHFKTAIENYDFCTPLFRGFQAHQNLKILVLNIEPKDSRDNWPQTLR